jgi:hypothetical protein
MWRHKLYDPYCHRGWGYHWHTLTPDEELELLKDYKRRLELELQYVTEKISELEKKKLEK